MLTDEIRQFSIARVVPNRRQNRFLVLADEAPQVCVIDSVQTLRAAEPSGASGSVGQVREVASQLMEVAKARGIAVILVGHVTKEGALAGPRVLEHLVDCVLQFEGERERPYRELRALKNRFGSTNEAGLFEMRQGGLVEVLDASARFVAEATRAAGSVVLAAMEGYSFIPNSFGGKPANLGSREEAAKLRTLSDKAQVVDHVKKGFDHAKKELEALDPSAMTGKRKVMGMDMSASQAALGVGGDLHEHLGQLIAYARTNHIVPPWSK